MSYRIVPGGTGLASTTPCVLLPSALLAQLNAQFPGWQSAANSGGMFSFYGAPGTGQLVPATCNHTIVVTIATGGPIGMMAASYTVDGGSVQGPFTSSLFSPNLPVWTLAITGTPTTLSFQNTTFPLGATFTIPPLAPRAPYTATGLPAGANVYSYVDGYFGPPVSVPLGSMTLTLATLADAVPGATVLFNSGIGQGWTAGVITTDGTTINSGGSVYPSTARAVAGLVGYSTPTTTPDPNTYALAVAANGEAWFTGGGLTFYGGSVSTLASVSGLVAIETVPSVGPWVVRTV